MSRVRISEYKAKSLVYPYFRLKYRGHQISAKAKTSFNKFPADKTYVIKVDEGIKKRQKNGLMAVNIKPAQINKYIKKFNAQGYNNLLLEENIIHKPGDEKYLALERTKEGVIAYYSNHGGVNIEDNKNKVQKDLLTDASIPKIASHLQIPEEIIENLSRAFEDLYFSFIETNPFLVKHSQPIFLDIAVEVDSGGEFFVNEKWTGNDFIETDHDLTQEELRVKALAKRSSASFKLNVLNPKGSIFALFSGGGASIVLADEIANLGRGSELVNYAEYSGNPNKEDTYQFTKTLLSLLESSPAKHKIIYIAGGVANFTDIRITFSGIIMALDEVKNKLKKEGVKIYVRRGGPHQEEGLGDMRLFLNKAGIKGGVYGPEMILTDIVSC